MKFRLKQLLIALVATVAAAAVQAQPNNTAHITQIAVSGGSTFGAPDNDILTPPNESFGPALSRLDISALGVGTFPATGWSYNFFVNGVSIGVVDSVPGGTPAVAPWTPPQPGVYFITVQATGIGNPVTSLPVRYFATGTIVSSPVSGTLVPAGSSVVLKADATVSAGFIKQIQFFDNGVAIGSPDTTAPYSIIYAVPGAAGSAHNITARATDNNDNLLAASSPITLSVVTAITPVPTNVISNPDNGATVAVPSSPLTVKVDATSTSGFIQRVELYIDGELFGTDISFPYEFSWQPTVVGTYNLVSLAYDDKNNVVASPTNAVRIAAPPTVTITTPSNGGTVTGGSPTQISATASDSNVGGSITKVQFFVDDAFVGESTSPSSGNTYTITATLTQNLDANGNVIPSVITALATDNFGISGISNGVSVTVTSGGSGGGTVIGIPPNVSVTSPTASSVFAVNGPVTITGSADDPDGNIASVQFIVNGLSVGIDATYPYDAVWTPTSLGTYAITARAIDNDGNSVTSSAVTVSVGDPSSSRPTVAITSPTPTTSLTTGQSQTVTATASDSDGVVASVQFFVNGQPLSTDLTFPFTAAWVPGAPGTYALTARATDNVGNQGTSSTVTVTVGGGSAPSVALTNPSSARTVNAGVPITLTATATDSDGTITGVQFFANGISVGSSGATPPYSTSWTPTAAGSYSIVARATDNSGSFTNSSPVVVTVSGNQASTVTITSPTVGNAVFVGSATTLRATASDPDGIINNVQFFANGVPIGPGSLVNGAFQASFTPTAEGVFRITAMATDNAGAVTTSSEVGIIAVSSGGSGSTAVYTGTYQGGFEQGKFALIAMNGTTVTFIGHRTSATGTAFYYYPEMELDSAGGFSRSEGGVVKISGTISGSSASGSINNGGLKIFVGIDPSISSSVFAAGAGYYTGSLSGRPDSSVTAIVGADGSIMLRLADGTVTDVGDGRLAPTTGAFTLTTVGGSTVTGTINPSTRFLTANITGAITASVTGALATGGTFSDGTLRGLSTRGFVGTGSNIMIAGFVVGGSTPKQIIVRGMGPSMTGVGGVLADPTISLFVGSTNIGTNNDWVNSPANAAAMGAVGLTPPSSPKESVLVTTLNPGVYTAQLSGVGSTTGVGLIEIYDVDTSVAYTAQKVSAISTRGFVNTGDGALIAGFYVNGTAPKKVLVQAVGPSLPSVSGLLADPIVKIFNSSGTVVRENDNWENGNDAALVRDAASRSGATALAAGAKDAAILINLPPGIYTVVVTGAGNSTGVALVNVFEVP